MKIREVPAHLDPSTRQLLTDLRNAVLSLQPTKNPPAVPGTFIVVPLPGANRLEWSLTDADSYDVLVSATPTWSAAAGWIIDAGRSNTYTDSIGTAAVKRWYWVRARRGNVTSAPTAAISSTTLALGTGASITTPTRPGTMASDGTVGGQLVPVRQQGGKYERQ